MVTEQSGDFSRMSVGTVISFETPMLRKVRATAAYTVTRIDGNGSIWFLDDDGIERCITSRLAWDTWGGRVIS